MAERATTAADRDALVSKHYTWARDLAARVARRMRLPDPEAAIAEAVGHLFTAGVRGFDKRRDFRAFAASVIVRKLVDVGRRKRPACVSLDGLRLCDTLPAQLAEHCGMCERLAFLPAGSVTLLRERYCERLSYAEIAGRHGVPVRKVKIQIRAAFAVLRERI
jgi:RNA polymerase sigma factor (sigma-70 family)